MFISILLAILHLVLKIVLSILAVIPFLDFISAQVNFWLSFKIINFIGLSFSVIEFIIFILLAYIVLGVLLGRIFYLPLLTNIVKKIVNRYN